MKDTHRMRSRLTAVILMTTIFVAGLLASRYVYLQNDAVKASGAATGAATLLVPPRALPDFELIGQSAQSVSRQDLAGQWTLVFMGFTNCGHVCPTTLFTLSEAVRQLSAPPQILFVSVDPGRDSPAVINTYVRGFGAAVAGATGTDAQLRRFAGSLGASFRVGQADDRYVVNHSSAVFLLDPATQLHAVFGAPHDAAVIAGDLARIMNAQTGVEIAAKQQDEANNPAPAFNGRRAPDLFPPVGIQRPLRARGTRSSSGSQ